MKLNFEIDLSEIYSDYEEAGSLDEMLADRIRESIENGIEAKIVDHLLKDMSLNLSQKLNSKLAEIEQQIDEKADSLLDDFLHRKVNITDRWGDVIKSNISVVDLMKEKFDSFMDESVGSDGKPTSYGGKKRLDYIIDRKFQRDVEYMTDKVVKEVQKRIKEEVESQLGKKISDKLLKELDILGGVK
ncbi:hypothetical protein [Terribacillus halophilus]|uniref:hypothetical protein n=1 Tax=Terribacillus halophilus TaxID=361279 RepID=UPI0039825203